MLEANDRALAEIPALVAEGVPSLKLFLAYSQRGAPLDDGALLDVWHAVADAGGLVQAHCENAGIIGRRLAQARARAAIGYDGLAASRPPVSEVEAVRRAVSFAEASGAETYCVHLSTTGAVEAVRRARADGLRVHGECCPHHLLLHEDRYAGPRAGDFVMSPPLRAPEHAEALWRGLADGTLEVIAADHAAWPAPFKAPGPSFLEAVHGAAGNGLLLPLLSAQVGRQPGFGWEALARVTAEAPARIFRLPGKGAIRSGYDADLVLLDPARQAPVPAVPPHWQVDNGIFRGLPAITPRLVLRRGVELARDGAYVGPAAGGRFVAGTLSR
jgi:dihydropyrimidinase